MCSWCNYTFWCIFTSRSSSINDQKRTSRTNCETCEQLWRQALQSGSLRTAKAETSQVMGHLQQLVYLHKLLCVALNEAPSSIYSIPSYSNQLVYIFQPTIYSIIYQESIGIFYSSFCKSHDFQMLSFSARHTWRRFFGGHDSRSPDDPCRSHLGGSTEVHSYGEPPEWTEVLKFPYSGLFLKTKWEMFGDYTILYLFYILCLCCLYTFILFYRLSMTNQTWGMILLWIWILKMSPNISHLVFRKSP
jgi:hypothetical protein